MNRRRFLFSAGGALLTGLANAKTECLGKPRVTSATAPHKITLFLCGDVMTGRGIDQILPHPGEPHLREPFLRSAVEYVKLAERKSGRIVYPVDFGYVWGSALNEWERVRPSVRIANLETTVTSRGHPAPNRGIHYRMHPKNLPCLMKAGFDCLVLSNNHAMDFGRDGLMETLEILKRAGIRTAGAGQDTQKAAEPAIIDVPDKGRVLVFAWGMPSSGVMQDLAAGMHRSGLNVLSDLSQETVKAFARQVHAIRRPRDVVVASIHWGANWSFNISEDERDFARGLIKIAGVDVVHGHSAHHVKGIEVYRDRPILYGCGDFLNDYEGIAGYEEFRGDLALMYFPELDPETGKLEHFGMTPMQIRQFRIGRAPKEGLRWLADTLNREGQRLGTGVAVNADGTLRLNWR